MRVRFDQAQQQRGTASIDHAIEGLHRRVRALPHSGDALPFDSDMRAEWNGAAAVDHLDITKQHAPHNQRSTPLKSYHGARAARPRNTSGVSSGVTRPPLALMVSASWRYCAHTRYSLRETSPVRSRSSD